MTAFDIFKYVTGGFQLLLVLPVMAALWNRAGHYIFALWFLSFFFLLLSFFLA